MLVLENVSVKRGGRAVAEGLNLALEAGRVYTVLGPNGCGKSSLLQTLFGLLPFEGSIRYGRETLGGVRLRDWQKRIGYMPQDTAADAALTALEAVVLGRLHALNMHIGDELLAEAAALLDTLGIARAAHLNVCDLSGGQRQLVMFAQVLMGQPEILLLDEPVSALDMHHQINLLEEVCRHTRGQGLTTVMVLHDLSLAAQFSDGLILLGQGRLNAFGSPEDVLQTDLLGSIYQVDIEMLRDSRGAPVIRPLRPQA